MAVARAATAFTSAMVTAEMSATLPVPDTVDEMVDTIGRWADAGTDRIYLQVLDLADLDPFVHLDQMGEVHYAPGEPKGTPWHPHRGFETVTYLLAGRMRHKDNAGNEGVIVPGGVQWMTAGRGIVHSEMPEHEDGLLMGFQLWVNLPASEKMSGPRYRDVPGEQLPHWQGEGAPGSHQCRTHLY